MPAQGKRKLSAGGAGNPSAKGKKTNMGTRQLTKATSDVVYSLVQASRAPTESERDGRMQAVQNHINDIPQFTRQFLEDAIKYITDAESVIQKDSLKLLADAQFQERQHTRKIEISEQAAQHQERKEAAKVNLDAAKKQYESMQTELDKARKQQQDSEFKAKQDFITQGQVHATAMGQEKAEHQKTRLLQETSKLNVARLNTELADLKEQLKEQKQMKDTMDKSETERKKAETKKSGEEAKALSEQHAKRLQELQAELTKVTGQAETDKKTTETEFKKQMKMSHDDALKKAVDEVAHKDLQQLAKDLAAELKVEKQKQSFTRAAKEKHERTIEGLTTNIDNMERKAEQVQQTAAHTKITDAHAKEIMAAEKVARKKIKKTNKAALDALNKAEVARQKREHADALKTAQLATTESKAKTKESDSAAIKLQATIDELSIELEKVKKLNRQRVHGTSAQRQEVGGQSDSSKVYQKVAEAFKTVGGGIKTGVKSAAKAAAGQFTGTKGESKVAKDGTPIPDKGGDPPPISPDFVQSSSMRGDDDETIPDWVKDFKTPGKLPKKKKRKGEGPPPLPTSNPPDLPPPLPTSDPPDLPEAVEFHDDTGPGPTVAGFVGDIQNYASGIADASPALGHGAAYIGTAIALGGAHRAYNWSNPKKQPGPDLRPPPGMAPLGPMPKKKKQKTGPVIDADTEMTGGGDGSGRGTNEGRKQQTQNNFQSEGGYLTEQPWKMPQSQLLQNGSDPFPPPLPPDPKTDGHGPQDPLTPGKVYPPVVLPGDIDRATDSLRPRYGMVGPRDVIPSPMDQLRSDIAFDMFSFVQPGFGEGYDNKLFQYQQNTENSIQGMGRSFLPRQDDGRLNYQHPMPFQWQAVQDVNRSAKLLQREEDLIPLVNALVRKLGEGSSGVLGRDVGEAPVAVSSQGLRRDSRSVFEPVIQNADNMHPILDPAGYLLHKRGWRRDFSPWREPQVREIQPPMNRGPHLNKRRSLEVILP